MQQEFPMETIKTRVIIADGQPIIREGLRISLERGGLINVVGEAEDGYAATLAANTYQADVIILDAGLRKLECFECVTRIRQQSPATRILVTFMSEDPFEIQSFVEAGVSGFIAKTAAPQEYLNAVQALMGGGNYFSRTLVNSLFSQKRAHRSGANVFGLTSRETEILRFICGGFSNKDVARRLDLSVRTVETHRLNIRKKTNASRLRDLVNVARELGLADYDATRTSASGLSQNRI
jgi:two-component system, NarL family, nitrate/nitrite response regulator NarL